MIFFIFESFLGILDKKASLKQVFSCHSRDHSATTPRPVRTVTGGFGSDRFPALCPSPFLPDTKQPRRRAGLLRSFALWREGLLTGDWRRTTSDISCGTTSTTTTNACSRAGAQRLSCNLETRSLYNWLIIILFHNFLIFELHIILPNGLLCHTTSHRGGCRYYHRSST